ARLPELRTLLDSLQPPPGEKDLRGWEWHYLRRLATRPALLEFAHAGPVNSVAYSFDGKRLASASDDGTVKPWDANAQQEAVYTTDASTIRGTTVVFSKTGLLAAGWGDGTVRVYSAQSEVKKLFEFKAHGGAVTCLGFHPELKRLV